MPLAACAPIWRRMAVRARAGTGTRRRKSKSKSQARAANAPASLAKAVSLHMEGKLNEALQEINRALEAGEESADVYFAKAQIQFELQQYEDASKSYGKLLSVNPHHPAANFNRAICME